MRVRATLISALFLALLVQVQGAWSQSPITNESYDLNDNQVPDGWSLQAYGCCGGLVDGHLEAQIVDAHYGLRRIGQLGPGTESITLEWDGNLAYSYWGIITGVQVFFGSHQLNFTSGMSKYNAGIVYGGDGMTHLVTVYGDSYEWRYPTTAIYAGTFPLVYGNYRYTVTLTAGTAQFKGVSLSDGSTRFDVTITDPGADLGLLTSVEFRAYTTTDNNSWVDNISIEATGGEEPPQNELIAFWPMDETSGSMIADASGHNLNGTAAGTTIITGQVGNARSLNGSSDYIEVPDNNLIDITDEITIMLWAKFDPTDDEGFLISKRLYSDAACEINYGIKYGFSGGNHYLAFQYGTGCATGNSYALTNLTGMADGAWHHLAVSLRFGDPSSARWMIDGTAWAGTWTKWNGAPGGGTDIPPTNSNTLEMGRQLSSSPGYAKCSMDQVRLYHGALSEAEIQGVYNDEYGPLYATVEGKVLSELGQGQFGVPLEIYDADGNIWKSLVTDDTGYYHVDSIPNGDYTITVNTPMGYVAKNETVAFSVNHVPVTVNFDLLRNVSDKVRNFWWWKTQLKYIEEGKPSIVSKANIDKFGATIFKHYYQRGDDYAIRIENATYGDGPRALDYDDIHEIFLGASDGSNYYSAVRALLTNMLNIASGYQGQASIVSEDGATAAQAIIYFAGLIQNGTDADHYLAHINLRRMHMGEKIPAGTIPLSTPNIMFKETESGEVIPSEFALFQNCPNPFNPTTEITFSLPMKSEVKLEIFNIAGRKVATLIDGALEAGNHTVEWDGRESCGLPVASGIYLYRLSAGEFVEAKKMALLK
jgi:hypothetical protein